MRRITQRIALLLMLLISITAASAQQPVRYSEQKSIMGIEVHFRFDNSQLDLGYMGNAQSLDRFASVINTIGRHRIDSVVIVSQSSPEGAYLYNKKLSQRRAATMHRAIEERHPELASCLHVHPDGESWERLRDYVASDTLMSQKTIDRVLHIIDSDISIDTKKYRLEHLPIFNYLRTTYYPRIRNSVFCIIYFDIPLETAQLNDMLTLETSQIEDTIEPIAINHAYTHRQPLMNVHTNLLYDALLTPNIGVEFYIGSHWSVAANYSSAWWSHDATHRYMQLIDGEFEGRRYFKKDNTHTGHYLSAYVHANLYDLSFDAKRAWQGEGAGLGMGYGYVWQPWNNERWKLEAFVRFGYYQSLYDPYHASDPFNGKYYYDWDGPIENFIRRNHRLRWLGPTGVGITISYDLFKRKVKLKN